MANIKVVIADPKLGKSVQVEANEDASKALRGKKLGETFKGELLDLTGYEFIVTGGSDRCGFPMRPDVDGHGRKKVLSRANVIGIKKSNRKGLIVRKTVVGNTVGPDTVQVNVKVVKAGSGKLPFPEPEAPAEAAPAEEKKE